MGVYRTYILVVCVCLAGCANNGGSGNSKKSALPFVDEALSGNGTAHSYPLTKEVKDETKYPQGSTAISGAKDFVFVLGQGSGWHGFNTLRVNEAGKSVYVFGEGKIRRAEFTLSAAQLDSLQKELTALDVFTLSAGYLANVYDGTQWFVKVQAGGQRKAIWCDNHFPARVVQISDFVAKNILPAFKKEIDAAVPVTLKPEEIEASDWK